MKPKTFDQAAFDSMLSGENAWPDRQPNESYSSAIEGMHSLQFSALTRENLIARTAPPLVPFTTASVQSLSPIKLAGAIKHDQGKPGMNLLSREALEQIALVMDFGKQKYDAHNWRKGFTWSRPLSAALRHLMAFNDGEDKDPESGLSHLAHAACCIMFLLEFEKTHKDLDDRWKPAEKANN
jgi:hypothetical protein